MIEDLEKLINFIQSEYNNITDKWENSINYKKINLIRWENESKGGNN